MDVVGVSAGDPGTVKDACAAAAIKRSDHLVVLAGNFVLGVVAVADLVHLAELSFHDDAVGEVEAEALPSLRNCDRLDLHALVGCDAAVGSTGNSFGICVCSLDCASVRKIRVAESVDRKRPGTGNVVDVAFSSLRRVARQLTAAIVGVDESARCDLN